MRSRIRATTAGARRNWRRRNGAPLAARRAAHAARRRSRLAKAHQHVSRQRRDFHHKTALALLRAYDTISLEDVRVANIQRNRRLAKSISDAGWAAFRGILGATAVCAGRRVTAIPPQYTSQDCGGCGERVPKSLSVRTHVCPSCGLVLDRDENAARNIQRAGQRSSGSGGDGCRDELRIPGALAAGSVNTPWRRSPSAPPRARSAGSAQRPPDAPAAGSESSPASRSSPRPRRRRRRTTSPR